MDKLDIGKALKLCMDASDLSIEDVVTMSGYDEDTVEAVLSNGKYGDGVLDKILESMNHDRDDLAVMTLWDEFRGLAERCICVSSDVAEFILRQRIRGCVTGIFMSTDSVLNLIGCESLDVELPVDKNLIIIQMCDALDDLREYGESVKVYGEGIEVDEDVSDDTPEDPEVSIVEGDDPWPADDGKQ